MSEKTNRSWNKLDNAAKIFPPTVSERDPKVIRCSCQMLESIDPIILQMALNKTMKKFSFYKSILKRGMFWYYLEESEIEPKVCIDDRVVCAPLYSSAYKSLLFRVTYYRKRINLEVYHALSDGTGALEFLRILVGYYIKIGNIEKFRDMDIEIETASSYEEKAQDSFYKYYDSSMSSKSLSESESNPKKVKYQKAYRPRGEKLALGSQEIIEAKLSVKELLNLSHEYEGTMTAFLVGLLIKSSEKTMPQRDRNKPFVVSVPVNLRNYFRSTSARNFFGVVNVSYDFSKQSSELVDIIKYVDDDMKKQLQIDNLKKRISKLSKFENLFITKIIPVGFKNIFMRIGYNRSDKALSAALSNVSKITMPEALDEYIDYFSILTCTKKLQVTVCSYQDVCTITFSSPWVSKSIQRNFYRFFSESGMKVEITSNYWD